MKTPVALLASLCATLPCAAELLLHDTFSGTAGTPPSGWTSVGSVAGDDNLSSGSLSVGGLAPSTGNKWTLNNSTNNVYRRDFDDAPVAGGATVFYSFVLQVDDITALTTTGSSNGLVFLNTSTSTSASNAVASIGLRKDAVDSTKFNIVVDGDFRGPSSDLSVKIDQQFSVGVPIFIVASYTLSTGAANTSTTSFWINPDSSSFGGTAPGATATDFAANRATIQSVMVTGSTSATASPNSWSLDEFRFGTTWADVTPAIPEPAGFSLLGGAACLGFALSRRRRR